jgi:hypothetical protein
VKEDDELERQDDYEIRLFLETLLLLTFTTFGMKLHNFQVLRIPPQQNTLHTPQCTNHPPPPSFPPVTTITILKSSPTCLITQFPHQEKAKIDSESFTSKLQQTCEIPRPLSAMCHLSLFKTSRTNKCRRMRHPALNTFTHAPKGALEICQLQLYLSSILHHDNRNTTIYTLCSL